MTDEELKLAPRVAEIMGLERSTIDELDSVPIRPTLEQCLDYMKSLGFKVELATSEAGTCIAVYEMHKGNWRCIFEEHYGADLEAAYRAVIAVGRKEGG